MAAHSAGRDTASPSGRSLADAAPAARRESHSPAEAGHGPAAPSLLQLQRTIGNRAVNHILQRRAAGFPAVATLRDEGPVWLPGGGDDDYDAVFPAVEEYADTAKIPAADHGKQIHHLIARIGEAIKKWEKTNKSVDTAVASGVFGVSRADKRRLVLKKVRDALTVELVAVQQQGLTAATAAHNQDRAVLQQFLAEGAASGDRRLRNACEWIMTAGKAKLYAVTATGDSYARLARAGRPPDKDEAWFPTGLAGSPGDLQSAPSTYNKDDIADNTGVNLDDDGKITGGWNQPGLITITKPSAKQKETVWETLRHEVQHDADKNEGRDAQAGARAAAEAYDAGATNAAKNEATRQYRVEQALQSYKTEYRAYSYQEGAPGGRYGQLDNTAQNQPHDGFNFSARQLAIFKHVYRGYEHTKTNWDANSNLTGGKRFRQAVVEYWDPDTEAVNKWNSPRVDDFWLKLDALGTKKAATTKEAARPNRDTKPVDAKLTDPADAGLVDLIKVAEKLDEQDITYILSESPAMMKKIDAHLDGRAKARLTANLTKIQKKFGKADVGLDSFPSLFD
jgi:hypothetical protein